MLLQGGLYSPFVTSLIACKWRKEFELVSNLADGTLAVLGTQQHILQYEEFANLKLLVKVPTF